MQETRRSHWLLEPRLLSVESPFRIGNRPIVSPLCLAPAKIYFDIVIGKSGDIHAMSPSSTSLRSLFHRLLDEASQSSPLIAARTPVSCRTCRRWAVLTRGRNHHVCHVLVEAILLNRCLLLFPLLCAWPTLQAPVSDLRISDDSLPACNMRGVW